MVYEEERHTTLDGKETVNLDVWGGNPDYRFRLSRTAPERPWVIRELARSARDPAWEDVERYLKIYKTSIDLSVQLVYDESLINIFSSPHISIQSAEELVLNDKRLARVDFQFQSPSDFTGPTMGLPSFRRVVNGSVILDPSDNWRPVEANLSLKDASKVHLTYTTDPNFPQLLSVRSLESVSASREYRESLQYSDISYDCSYPETDFRLSAYDLPEPQIKSNRIGVAWFIGLAAVIIIVVGALLKRRKLS